MSLPLSRPTSAPSGTRRPPMMIHAPLEAIAPVVPLIAVREPLPPTLRNGSDVAPDAAFAVPSSPIEPSAGVTELDPVDAVLEDDDARVEERLVADDSAQILAPFASDDALIEARSRRARIVALTMAGLAVALALIDASSVVLRLPIATIASAVALIGWMGRWQSERATRGRRGALRVALDDELSTPAPLAVLAATLGSALAWTSRLAHAPGADAVADAAVWLTFAALVGESLGPSSRPRALYAARSLVDALDAPSSATGHVRGGAVGSFVELVEGDVVSVDVVLERGEVESLLWGDARLRVRRSVGDLVPATSLVAAGGGSGRVVASGNDRAFGRILADMLLASRVGATAFPGIAHAALAVAAFFGAAAVTVLASPAHARITVASVATAMAILATLAPPTWSIAARERVVGVVAALARGIAFRDLDAFARAADVRTAILCGRGTVTASTFDGCEIFSLSAARSPNEILALAASLESTVPDALATAIVEQARARGVALVDVRDCRYEPGLGVLGDVAPGGAVLIGGRALCLREHVPTAEHEARIEGLEAAGRQVVVVVAAGRAIGLVALSTTVRDGSIAAVQRLHDIDVDPVLLGGGSRGWMESVARAIDVAHIRPEIPPHERLAELRRVSQSAGPVAVIGHLRRDGEMLAAADISIALSSAGMASATVSVALLGDALVPAVEALAIARKSHAQVRSGLAIGLAPVILAVLPVALGILPIAIAPLAALGATLALGVRDAIAGALPDDDDARG